jgi:hypothetical protein
MANSKEHDHFAPLSADITDDATLQEQSPLGPQPNPFTNNTAAAAPAEHIDSGYVTDRPAGPVERSSVRSSPRETVPPTNDRPSRHRLRPLDEMPPEVEGNRMHIDKSEYPDGFDLQFVTKSIYGQEQSSHLAGFYRRGWEPVRGNDFEGRFDGRWTPPGHTGPIEIDGMILVARDARWSKKAKEDDMRKAQMALAIKEQQLRGGQIEGVGFDGGSQHPSALALNKIRKSYERLQVPKDE